MNGQGQSFSPMAGMGGGGGGGGGGMPRPFADLGDYLSGRRAAGQNRRFRRQVSRMTGPAKFLRLTRRYLPEYLKALEPERVSETDEAALEERDTEQAMRALAYRSGLGISGSAQYATRSIAGKRQADVAEALLNWYRKAAQGAREAAAGTQARQAGAMTGAPYVSKGSFWEAPLDFIQEIIDDYTMGGGNFGGGGGGMGGFGGGGGEGGGPTGIPGGVGGFSGP